MQILAVDISIILVPDYDTPKYVDTCRVSSTGKTDSGTREDKPQDRQGGWDAEGPVWNGGFFPFQELQDSLTSPVKAPILPDWFSILSLFC